MKSNRGWSLKIPKWLRSVRETVKEARRERGVRGRAVSKMALFNIDKNLDSATFPFGNSLSSILVYYSTSVYVL